MTEQNTANAQTTDSTVWHTLTVVETLHLLESDATLGLSAAQAQARMEQYGPNRLHAGRKTSALKILLNQFSDFMILILIAAAILAGMIGDIADTLAIIAILALNAMIGFTQELRAEQAMNALKQLAAPIASVIREGRTVCIQATELVPGDIVLLEAGNLVPADLRLLEAAALQINEAALTGESVPSDKHTDSIQDPAASVGDRHNMVFKGTMITNGRGVALVVATGMQTQLGHIASLLEAAVDTQTPLQKRLAVFSKRLALTILVICALIFLAGLARGEPVLLMLLTAVSLAVAAIPEALPAVVTIALALGAYRLARHQALMRKLSSVETLGSITWICSDKTGTLTENRMQVDSVWHDGINCKVTEPHAATATELFTAMLLCNDATQQDGSILGEPTEAALLTAALAHGLDQVTLNLAMPRIAELPFESLRMRMTTFHNSGERIVAYTKGAPEAVIALCNGYWHSNSTTRQPWDAAAINAEAAAMAAAGLRVLAFAARSWDAVPATDAAETGLHFIGLAGLIDPPRAEAAAAIATCKAAGITAAMITGDHPATALAVAKRLDLAQSETELLTGKQLAEMDDAALAACVTHVRVYARMDPAQKIRIVKALQARDEYVAMTGDGVNDAPALRQADIGVSMGRIGTDVAREASDMVLLDDNFATIVSAVRGGRHIYNNIRRFIRYILTTNLAEVLLIVLAPLFGMPLPLLPIQILWVNLVTDGLPGLALTMEPPEADLMRRPPRPPSDTLFAQGLLHQILWTGLLMAVLVLGIQAFGLAQARDNWQTLVFTALTFTQLGNALVIRSDRDSLWHIGLLSNRFMVLTMVLTIGLHMALLYVPMLNHIFSTQPLGASDLLLCAAVAVVVMLAVEAEKVLIRRGLLYPRKSQPDTKAPV